MASIAERKSEAINLRMSPSTKELLRLVAEREHRTLSNMLEVLILEHAQRLGVNPTAAQKGEGAKRAKPRSL
jgi:uncharacterized protein (DUF1778 family)